MGQAPWGRKGGHIQNGTRTSVLIWINTSRNVPIRCLLGFSGCNMPNPSTRELCVSGVIWGSVTLLVSKSRIPAIIFNSFFCCSSGSQWCYYYRSLNFSSTRVVLTETRLVGNRWDYTLGRGGAECHMFPLLEEGQKEGTSPRLHKRGLCFKKKNVQKNKIKTA